MSAIRSRVDRCPGTYRPWPADDGLLVRLRLIAGRVRVESLLALADAAERFGDGAIYFTSRANVQVRGFAGSAGQLLPEQRAAIEATGLVPSPAHDVVRNVLASPLTGVVGGLADLWPVCAELDRLICADADLAKLPGRFLFVADDGRGDVIDRSCDLGLVALDANRAQLRVGANYGEIVDLTQAAWWLYELARLFMQRRGHGPSAPWHVCELDHPLLPSRPRDVRCAKRSAPLEFGPVVTDSELVGHHWSVSENGLDRTSLARIVGAATDVVVTPWRGIFVPRGRDV